MTIKSMTMTYSHNDIWQWWQLRVWQWHIKMKMTESTTTMAVMYDEVDDDICEPWLPILCWPLQRHQGTLYGAVKTYYTRQREWTLHHFSPDTRPLLAPTLLMTTAAIHHRHLHSLPLPNYVRMSQLQSQSLWRRWWWWRRRCNSRLLCCRTRCRLRPTVTVFIIIIIIIIRVLIWIVYQAMSKNLRHTTNNCFYQTFTTFTWQLLLTQVLQQMVPQIFPRKSVETCSGLDWIEQG